MTFAYFASGSFDLCPADLWRFFTYSVHEYFGYAHWRDPGQPRPRYDFYFKAVRIFSFFLYGLCLLCVMFKNLILTPKPFCKISIHFKFYIPTIRSFKEIYSCLTWSKDLILFGSTQVANAQYHSWAGEFFSLRRVMTALSHKVPVYVWVCFWDICAVPLFHLSSFVAAHFTLITIAL